MDSPIKLMATTDRHSDLVDGFTGEMWQFRKRGELVYWSDTVALVYDQHRKLINVNDLNRIQEQELIFKLNTFKHVEPDVMIFKNNAVVSNRKGTRKAGCPDLIVEVWSEDNKATERQSKFEIYSSNPLTEHWYLEQESDIISCYKGSIRLPDQHLKNILKTESGLEFDLRAIQTFDDTSWNSFVEYGFKGEQ